MLDAFKNKPQLVDQIIDTFTALKRFQLDIENALWYGNNKFTFNDIVIGVVKAEFDVYVFEKSILIATVEKGSQFDDYVIAVGAGDLDEILAHEEQMLKETRMRMCKHLKIYGRRGWEAPLRRMGWKHQMSILTKEA